jgi:hypothetical protein
MGVYEWLVGLSPWVKFSVGLLFLLISTGMWFAGYFWPWGWFIGAVLIMLSPPNDVQKKGYHD